MNQRRSNKSTEKSDIISRSKKSIMASLKSIENEELINNYNNNTNKSKFSCMAQATLNTLRKNHEFELIEQAEMFRVSERPTVKSNVSGDVTYKSKTIKEVRHEISRNAH
jgi:hypothetical protein